MKTVVVASNNPVKAAATRAGFRRMFPHGEFRLLTVAVPSAVGDQPRSAQQTLRGAETRALAAARGSPEADFWVGIEGGIEDTAEGMLAYAWVVVASARGLGRGRTGAFFLPEPVAELVRRGRELGEANDIVFGRENSKQQEGAVGIVTGKVMTRTELYEDAVVLALAPFKSAEVYRRPGSPEPS